MQQVVIEEIDGYTTRNLVQSKINDLLKGGWTVVSVTMEPRGDSHVMLVVFVLSKELEDNKKKIL